MCDVIITHVISTKRPMLQWEVLFAGIYFCIFDYGISSISNTFMKTGQYTLLENPYEKQQNEKRLEQPDGVWVA